VSEAKSQSFRFGSFELNSANKTLSKDGQPVSIGDYEPKILAYLIQNRDRIVSKEEILKNVWGEIHVKVGAVKYHISQLRRVISEDFVRTCGRQGYRFVQQSGKRLPKPRQSGGIEDKYGRILGEVEFIALSAERALQSSLHDDATKSANNGLEMLKKMPRSAARSLLELRLLSILNLPYMRIFGYGSPQVEQIFLRIEELCRKLDDAVQPVPALWALWLFYHVRGNLLRARKHAERCLQLAMRVQNPSLLAGSYAALGHTKSHLGLLIEANDHLTEAVAQAETTTTESYAHLHLIEPGVASYCQLAVNYVIVGKPEQALLMIADGIARAREIDPKESLGFALVYAAWTYQLRREQNKVAKYAEEALDLAQRCKLPQIHLWALIFASWADARTSEPAGPLSQIETALSMQALANAQIARTVFLSMQAEACLFNKMYDQAAAAIAKALPTIRSTREQIYEAELLRLKGITVLTSSPVEANRLFRRSIVVARGQGAQLFALRAALALARLLPKGKSKNQAIKDLKTIYSSFEEGQSTADLTEVNEFLSKV